MSLPLPPLRRIASVSALAALAACGGSSQDAPVIPLRDSAGVEIRTNTRVPRWTPGESWWLETVLAIAPPQAPAEALLGQVVAGALDGEGRAYVLDGTDGRVRVFASDGTWLRTLGTIGGGPGELSGNSNSVVVRTGADGEEEVWVPDPEQARVVRFATDGSPLPDMRTEAAGPGTSWWQRGGDGRLYRRSIDWADAGDGVWRGTDRLQRVLRLGPGVTDVAADEIVFEPVSTFVYPRPDLEKSETPVLPASVTNAPAWAVGADGTLAWLSLDAPQLRTERPEGPDRWVRSESWVPRPPSEDDERLLERMAEEAFRKRGLIGTDVFDHPAFLPAITDVLVGPEETFWVQRAGALREAHPSIVFNDALPPGWGGQTWEVLDRDGVYLGSVEFPPRFRVLDVRGDWILGAQHDLNYEDRLLVLEIRRPGSEAQ